MQFLPITQNYAVQQQVHHFHLVLKTMEKLTSFEHVNIPNIETAWPNRIENFTRA